MESITPVRVEGLAAISTNIRLYRDPAVCMDRMFREHGAVISLGTGLPQVNRGSELLFLMGARYNAAVLNETEFLRPAGIWPVRGPGGSAQNNLRKNMLTFYGARHAHIASLFKPGLSRARVNRLVPDTRQLVCEELDAWPAGETADIFPLIRKMVQRVALAMLFDEPDKDKGSLIVSLLAEYHHLNWTLRPRLQLKYGPQYRRVLSYAEELQDLLIEWAGERSGCTGSSDIRSTLCNANGLDGKPLAPKRVAAHLAGSLLAAFETQVSVMSWMLFLLAQHPEITAELLDQLATLGPDDLSSVNGVSNAPLIDWTINETLRLIPPVPIISLKAHKDGELFGISLPQRSTIVLSPHITHRDPEVYDEPSRFRPERWDKISPSTYQYLPFSGGPRRCPGYWHATNNMRIMLSEILLRYRLTVSPGARIDRKYEATTIPKYGIPMEILKQDGRCVNRPIRGNILDIVDFGPQTHL